MQSWSGTQRFQVVSTNTALWQEVLFTVGGMEVPAFYSASSDAHLTGGWGTSCRRFIVPVLVWVGVGPQLFLRHVFGVGWSKSFLSF